jgi:hypothetical protein
MGGMAAMSTPAQGTAGRAGAVGATNAPVFYLGLAAYLGTFLWSSLRRWRRACRPVRVLPCPADRRDKEGPAMSQPIAVEVIVLGMGPLSTSGPIVELGGRFVRWRTDRARRQQP